MAGQASRLPGLPCSKEILPVTAGREPGKNWSPAEPVCKQLLGQMRDAGIETIYLVIREGKWDIPATLGDGTSLELNLAYLMMGRPFGTPYSVDQAYTFVRDRRVVLGFPDMCFYTSGIFTRLLEYQASSRADVVLGIFPADRPQKADMLELDDDHRIKQLVIKPPETTLKQTWGVAVWTPVFSDFMHTYLATHQHGADRSPELYIGDVIRDAVQAGLDVRGIPVSEQPFIDIGTREDLDRVSS